MKNVDIDEYTWDVLSVNANRMKRSSNNPQRCSNHEFLLERLKNYQGGRNLTPKLSRGPTTWKDTRKNALTGTVAKKQTEQLYKVSTLCLEDHHFKKEELESVGELSNVCSQMVLKCLFWQKLVDPAFYGQ